MKTGRISYATYSRPRTRGPNEFLQGVLLLLIGVCKCDCHQLLVGYPPNPALLPYGAQQPTTLLFRTDIPVVLPTTPEVASGVVPALPPAFPAPVGKDDVRTVLRAGQPAILLIPHTPTSGVYHLSDSQHRFPPFVENVVNRVQNFFSTYTQIDPFAIPFPTSSTTRPSTTPLSPDPVVNSSTETTLATPTSVTASASSTLSTQSTTARLVGPSQQNRIIEQTKDSYLPTYNGRDFGANIEVDERPPAPPPPPRRDQMYGQQQRPKNYRKGPSSQPEPYYY